MKRLRVQMVMVLIPFLYSASVRSAPSVELESYFKAGKSNKNSVGESDFQFTYELYLPRTIEYYKSNASIPLFIVFDKQNVTGYRQTMHTIDYLTTMSSIPEAVILSIGFENGEERFLLSKYREDKGRLEDFFQELNKLVDSLESTSNVSFSQQMCFGHSRTGYVAMQYLFNYPDRIFSAFAGSPQKISTANEKNIYANYINYLNENMKRRYLFFSAGKEVFGDGDEEHTRELINFLNNNRSRYFFQKGEVLDCDHFNSLNVVLNENLIKMFSGYNEVLIRSFDYIQLDNEKHFERGELDSILIAIQNETDLLISKDPTYFISLFYTFYNDYGNLFTETESAQLAEWILLEGINTYEQHYVFVFHYVFFLVQENRIEEARTFFMKSINGYKRYQWADKAGMIEELSSVVELLN